MYSWISISETALYHNLRTLRDLVDPFELGCVLKNNAYGHDIDVISDFLMDKHPLYYLFTAGTREAIRIKQRHPEARVCSMSFINTPYEDCVAHQITCGVYTQSMIDGLNNAARAHKTEITVHLKVDTGMYRLGVPMHEVDWFIQYIRSCRNVYLQGVYTHLADLALEDQQMSVSQERKFEGICQEHGDDVLYWHSGSSGSVLWPPSYNMTRVGSALYGIPKSDAQMRELCRNGVNLIPVLAWHARVISTKWIPAGMPIGYDGAYITDRPTRVAFVPIGYGDGYPRSLSHQAYVVVRGRYAPIVGLISMNIITIDVTDIPEVTEYDIVTLIGDSEKIAPTHLARLSGRITLEVLSNINPNIPRIIDR